MKIKNILSVCLVCCGFATALTSCSTNEEAFFTANEDDAPRILNTDIPADGFSINHDVNFSFEILTTPTDFTTVKWYADDKELYTGNTIDMPFEAGSYTLKIVAITTRGKQTSRTTSLTVRSLDGEPVVSGDGLSRFQDPGATVTLNGSNLFNVKKVKINGRMIDVTNSTNEAIQFTIPADMPEGSYRISLINVIDEKETSFGGGILNISSQSIVSGVSFIGLASGKVDLTGRKLENVTAVTVGDQACTIVSQEAEKMTIQLPAIADGSYELKATTSTGAVVSFMDGSSLLDKASIQVAQVIINQSSFLGTSNGVVTLKGMNLTDVATVTVKDVACTIVSKDAENLTIQLPEMEEGTFVLKATTASGSSVKFLNDGQLVEEASIKVTLIAEEILWEGNHSVDWGTIFEMNDLAAKLKEIAKPRAILRLYVKRTASDYCKGCAAVNWADIVKGGTDPNRGDVDIAYEDTYIDFQLTAKSMELLEQNNFQVVGHGFDLQKITLIQPSEEELWSGSHAIDWGTIWEDDGTITAKLKQMAGPGSILRLYVKRTADDYCIGCAAVGWADIVKGGTDSNRGDVSIAFEDTEVEFKLTTKSMELLNSGNLQVVGHGFDLQKITIE